MKKRNKYFLKEKEFIHLKKKLDKIKNAQQKLGWVELEIPRFNGWVAKLETRQDIKNREDGWIFEGIVQLFGTTVFARKIEEFDWNRSKKERYLIHQKPRIKGINQYTYDTLLPQVQKYFEIDIYSKRSSWGGSWYFCNIPNFYFDIVYEKDFITKIKISDCILEQEEAEIKSNINTNFFIENKWYKGVPKSYRKSLNRSQRAKSKSTLYSNWKGGYEIEYEDDYRSAKWYW